MRYHGGKWRLAEWIIEHFSAHRSYLEPFGGGASVLLQKPRSHSEIYNDRWGDVVNVFRILRDPELASELKRVCELTPFARAEMQLSDECAQDPIESARRMIFRSFSGFGSASSNSLHKTGFRSNSRQSGTSPARDWMHWPAHIDSFTKRLAGVVIENRDAIGLIWQHDKPDTLIYCDPPYVQSTRRTRRRNSAYRHEMTDDDHLELGEVLHNVDGAVVLSGYRCELYDELYGDWQRDDCHSYADGAAKRIESVWMNDLAMRQGQQRLAL